MTISVILMSSSAQTCSRCPLTPPSISRECQQDRADDHHAFHEDAKPGDLSLQLGTRPRSSSVQLRMTCNSVYLFGILVRLERPGGLEGRY